MWFYGNTGRVQHSGARCGFPPLSRRSSLSQRSSQITLKDRANFGSTENFPAFLSFCSASPSAAFLSISPFLACLFRFLSLPFAAFCCVSSSPAVLLSHCTPYNVQWTWFQIYAGRDCVYGSMLLSINLSTVTPASLRAG